MIPRELFDEYDRALAANASMLGEAIAQASEMMGAGAEWSEVYRAIVERFGGYAAAVAAEFYQELRDSSGITDPYEASIPEPGDADALAGDVARAVDARVEPQQTAQRLHASAKRRVMERADAVLVANAKADPAHPKWALVPHPGACAWCRFLASQDFAYSSEASALAARHDNCLCTPVVDFDVENPHLDGYDPGAYFDEYAEARSRIEADARAEWASMPPEERARYQKKGRGAYDRYLRNRIVQEMSSG